MRRGKSKGAWWAAKPDGGCIICHSPYIQMHHVFYGTANRKRADEYGYVIPLCVEHHTGGRGIHFNREMDIAWKRAAQTDFETRFGSRDDFIRIFGRNYL